MPARFCPQCGTAAVQAAKFCIECGAALTGGGARGGGWRITGTGSVVLASLVVAGLGIWTAILAPEPPRPAPGAGQTATAKREGTPATSGGAPAMPPDHPTVTLPEEAKKLLDGMAATARAKPGDRDAWLRLGQAYYRAGQLDPAYLGEALKAFQHVLELAPESPEAIRGLANVYYDRNEPQLAIPRYETLVRLTPDDLSVRTDLGTMYFYSGQTARAVAIYEDVIQRDPKFLQAHVNLGITRHQQGDDKAALAALTTARNLASDDEMRKRIDAMIAGLGSTPPPAGPESPPAATAAASPFQSAVEQAFRAHPIMGPRIVRFEWSEPGAGRVLVENFPMEGMPPAVREKFAARLADELRTAKSKGGVDGPVKMEIADATSRRVMATVTP